MRAGAYCAQSHPGGGQGFTLLCGTGLRNLQRIKRVARGSLVLRGQQRIYVIAGILQAIGGAVFGELEARLVYGASLTVNADVGAPQLILDRVVGPGALPLAFRQFHCVARQLLGYIVRAAAGGLGFEFRGYYGHAAEFGIQAHHRLGLELRPVEIHLLRCRIARVLAFGTGPDVLGGGTDHMIDEHFGELANHQTQQRQEAGGGLIGRITGLRRWQQIRLIGDDAAVIDVGTYIGIV